MIRDVNNRLSTPIQAIDKRSKTKTTEMLMRRAKVQTVKDLDDWNKALNAAYSKRNPSLAGVMDVYDLIDDDGHVKGIVSAIKNKIKAKSFSLLDPSGEIDEEATALLETEWFLKWIDLVVDAEFKGFSLVFLNDIIDNGFPDMKLIPREHCLPWLHSIKKELRGGIEAKNLIDYTSNELRNWHIMVKGDEDLGLYKMAAPHVLAKRAMFSAMWEFCEMFGIPYRIGKTDTMDPKRKKGMEDMLDKSGRAPWAVVDHEDGIDLLEPGKGGATTIFTDSINKSNQEMSKALSGGTGMFEDKAFVGSAEAQERMFFEFVAKYVRQVRFATNSQLLPRMATHGIIKEGRTLHVPHEQGLTSKEGATIIKDLSTFYSFDPGVVSNVIGIEVEGGKEAQPTSVMGDVKNLYKDFQ